MIGLQRIRAQPHKRVITTADVLFRAALIAREFGFATSIRCCAVMLSGRRTTFLELVAAAHRAPIPVCVLHRTAWPAACKCERATRHGAEKEKSQ